VLKGASTDRVKGRKVGMKVTQGLPWNRETRKTCLLLRRWDDEATKNGKKEKGKGRKTEGGEKGKVRRQGKGKEWARRVGGASKNEVGGVEMLKLN